VSRSAGRPGRAGLASIAISIAGTVAVGAAGPSLMEPPLPGGGPGWLPWSADLSLNPYLAVGLAAASLAAGALGLLLTLRAIRAGWLVSPRYVLLAGVLAALVAGTTRPFGTSDFLSYAAYGHELVTGHNPYLVAPRMLPGDPVARAVQDWAGAPSVYGALATGVFGAASLIGGASARMTVFAGDLVNTAAFVVTGMLLYQLARGRAARLRAALLWMCNPLLLQVLVAGSHVDGLAIAFSIGGLAILFPLIPNVPSRLSAPSDLSRPSWRRGALRGVAAGALLGLGFAVKPTVLLVALGLAIGLVSAPSRRRGIDMAPIGAISIPTDEKSRVLAGLATGFTAVAIADVALIGRAGIAQAARAGGLVSVGSPWRVVRTLLSQFIAEPLADDMVRWCAVVLAVILAAALLRHLNEFGALTPRRLRLRRRVNGPHSRLLPGEWPAQPRSGGVACAFVLMLAWLLAWPYVLPWYDATAWALLALLPASGFDWLLLARTTVLAFGYLPARATGITIPGGLRWMEPVLRSAVTPAVLAVLLAVLVYRLARPASGAAAVTADAEDAARRAPLAGSDHA
jgi:hypothetical protein